VPDSFRELEGSGSFFMNSAMKMNHVCQVFEQLRTKTEVPSGAF